MERTPDYKDLQFWLLCLSSFLFFSSFNMIIPELPGYLTSLGGKEYIGLIISLFTVTAGLSRPFSGKLADKVGRIPVMIFGSVVCFLVGFLYPVVSSVTGFLFLRFIHGFSTGFKPTGTSAYVADIVPHNRRGEAMGILGLAGSIGMASGPAIGGWIANLFSLNTLFYCSSAAAILSILILAGMKESLKTTEKFRINMLRLNKDEIFDNRVIVPSVAFVLTTFSFGVILTLIPMISENLGLKNKGLFFTAFTLASMSVRFFAGKASDKYGRIPLLRISALLLTISMVMIAFTNNLFVFFSAAVVFGLAIGMNSPSIFAWTIDLSEGRNLGRAMATVYIALEIGIGCGALISGTMYGINEDLIDEAFLISSGFSFIAFIYLSVKSLRRPLNLKS